MSYAAQTWTNGPAGATPLSAARLNHIEAGVSAVDSRAAALAATAGVSRVLTKLESGTNIKVTFLGDSGLEGSTATAGNDTASVVCTTLATRFGVTVTKSNQASSGFTTAYAMNPNVVTPAKFATALADRADLYVIAFGHNDIRSDSNNPSNGYPVAAAKAALEHMIRRLRIDVPGADIVVTSTWPYPVGGESSDAFLVVHGKAMRQIAAAYGCGYFDYYAALRALGVGLSSAADETYTPAAATYHPNDAGHAVWAAGILALLPADADLVPASPTVPVVPQFGAERYTQLGWLDIPAATGGTRVAGTIGYRLIGSWAGTGTLPVTSSTATDAVEHLIIGSELLIRLDVGVGQGVVKVEADGSTINAALDLSTLASQSRITIAGLGPGIHRVVTSVVSGSVTYRSASYLPCQGQRIPHTSALCSYSAGWLAPLSDIAYFEGTAARPPTNVTTETVTVRWVGTALWWQGHVYAASMQMGVTNDGGSESTTDWNVSPGTTGSGGHLITSGLPYGQHTTVIRVAQTGRTAAPSTFFAFDESRTLRPDSMSGLTVTGESVVFGAALQAKPLMLFSPDDNTATAPPRGDSIATTGFVAAGTASARSVWRAETGQIAW